MANARRHFVVENVQLQNLRFGCDWQYETPKRT